jgi:hypothetical protein
LLPPAQRQQPLEQLPPPRAQPLPQQPLSQPPPPPPPPPPLPASAADYQQLQRPQPTLSPKSPRRVVVSHNRPEIVPVEIKSPLRPSAASPSPTRGALRTSVGARNRAASASEATVPDERPSAGVVDRPRKASVSPSRSSLPPSPIRSPKPVPSGKEVPDFSPQRLTIRVAARAAAIAADSVAALPRPLQAMPPGSRRPNRADAYAREYEDRLAAVVDARRIVPPVMPHRGKTLDAHRVEAYDRARSLALAYVSDEQARGRPSRSDSCADPESDQAAAPPSSGDLDFLNDRRTDSLAAKLREDAARKRESLAQKNRARWAAAETVPS